MSDLSGKFKAKVTGIYTSEPGEKPKLTIGFKLTEQFNQGLNDYEAIDGWTDDKAYKNYYVDKNVSPGKERSSFEVSKDFFRKDWGFEMDSYDTVAEMASRIVGEEKTLVITPDDYKGHNIKYINGTKKPGRELRDLLQ